VELLVLIKAKGLLQANQKMSTIVVPVALCYIYKNITSKKLKFFLKIYCRPLFKGH